MFNLINTPTAEGTEGLRRSDGGTDDRALDVRPVTALFDLQLYLSEAADSFLRRIRRMSVRCARG